MPAKRRNSLLIITLHMLVIVSLACSLPSFSRQSSPEPGPTTGVEISAQTPIGTPTSLPPALVETSPPPGAEIPLTGPITLHFNQAMDQLSVEASLSGQPALSGRFLWESESALSFIPDSPFLPGADLTISIGPNARSLTGLGLLNPITLNYRTVGYLRLTQPLPEPRAAEVDPTSAVVAVFNRPVAALGQTHNEPAFTLEPEASGRGEWINTSTYIFYPEPALKGGETYTASINQYLTGVDGSPLDPSAEGELSWSFSTSRPVLLSIDASDEFDNSNFGVRLDAEIVLTFNQPVDLESVKDNFRLLRPNGREVPGNMTANSDQTVLTFSPDSLLDRNTSYSVTVGAQAADLGGTPLGVETSIRIYTVPAMRIDYTNPLSGGVKETYSTVILHFTAHLTDEDLLKFISITPEAPNLFTYVDSDKRTVYINGNFAPETSYSLTVSPETPDAWGNPLGSQYVLNFRTLPLEPQLVVQGGMDVLFMLPDEPGLPVQVTNLSQVSYTLGGVPLDDLISMLGYMGYDIRRTYLPRDARSYQQATTTSRNISESVLINLSPEGELLTPGIYHLRFNLPPGRFYSDNPLIVVSNLQVAMKVSSENIFIWAVDLRDQTPAANRPVLIYDESGKLAASGETDSEGIFLSEIPPQDDPYLTYIAVLGNPGEDLFGAALSTWNQELFDWSLGIPLSYEGQGLKTYIYSDRPVYQPGQKVYFRAVARQAFNGRYSLPNLSTLPLTIYSEVGEKIADFDLPLSGFGTTHGEFLLPADAQPGVYRIMYGRDYNSALSFNVANYRKPEIDLRVAFEAGQLLPDQPVKATIQAGYFFGAPASNLTVRWSLHLELAYVDILPGYQVGSLDTAWLYGHPFYGLGGLGGLISQGSGVTGADGSLVIDAPPLEIPEYLLGKTLTLTLEATAADEAEQPVSSRASALMHPGPYYAGVKPDNWTGRAGSGLGFEVLAVEWDGSPVKDLGLEAVFNKVVWVRQESAQPDDGLPYAYQPIYTKVGSASFITGEDGVARLAFTAPDPGVYQLEISGGENLAGRIVTQAQVWVEGPGGTLWPPLTNQRVKIIPDKDQYLPGESAQVFVPNPLDGEALALITIERSAVLRHQIVSIQPGGETLSIPLESGDAPNVYVSVIMLGKNETGIPDFRHGIANLTVQPDIFSLQVEITPEPSGQLGPGDNLAFRLRVTDEAGTPVQGEFSLSLVDKAVLALTAPNSIDIHTAFYGQQPLGLRTALSLAAHTLRRVSASGVGGGGGGDEMLALQLREDFRDTAFWNAEVLTDATGEAVIRIRLPDNLTTWVVDVRGLTQDSRMGQARAEIVTSKDLMVRPVTPRFLVAGDRLAMAAIVHNNTSENLSVDVSIRTSGFILDEQASQVQRVEAPAGGRTRVEWWGTVQDSGSVEMIFSAVSGPYHDSSRPSLTGSIDQSAGLLPAGALPVLHYTVRQTFASSGILEERGERLELVSIPAAAAGQGKTTPGSLILELTSSLGAAAISSLDALERHPYENNESIVSRLLPNLETYRALQTFGIEAQELNNRLERSLQDSLSRLLANQNPDGSWSWWTNHSPNRAGDPDVTAYILYSLTRANQMGMVVDNSTIRRAVNFLTASLPAPEMLLEDWQFDRLAFQHFALAEAGAGIPDGLTGLYENRSRLSPSSQAFMVLAFDKVSGVDGIFTEQTKTLLSDLKTSAVRSSTGIFWESSYGRHRGLKTPVSSSAVVVYVLAQKDPAASVLPDAVRYLMAHRSSQNAWGSTYDTAWALMAVVEYMKGAGELGGDFAFSASLNGVQFASGQAREGGALANPVSAVIPAGSLFTDQPNALVLRREGGLGRLYYSAQLNVHLPVEAAPAVNQGMVLTREYFRAANFRTEPENLTPINSGQVGEVVVGKVTIVLPHDAYYLMVEDFIPAGAELIDMQLETSARREGDASQYYNPRVPLAAGWGWWYFYPPSIYNDRIVWASDYLPAGTYQLVYTLDLLQPGDFQVLPARSWQNYFPEVQGSSHGTIFKILPNR